MERRELPEGWEWKNLREVALKYTNGGTPSTTIPEYWSGNIPWTTSKSIISCTLNAGEKFISKKAIEKSSSNVVPKENVLIATRVGIGKSAVNLIDIAISQDLTGIILDKNIITPEYLVWYLHNQEVLKKLETIARGTTIKGLQRSDLERIDIPLPPLPVQRRIVEILEQADALRQLRAQADAKTQKLLQSVFYEMFGDPVRNEKGWEIKTIQELTNNSKNAIKRGPFGSSIKKDFFVSSGYKVYEQKNVIYQNFTLGHYYIDEEKFKELKDFEISPDDLLISCSGTIGKIAIVPSAIEKGVINQALLKLTLDQQKIYPIYFKFMFELVIEAIINQNVRGSAMVNIVSVEELKKIKFPIPPLPLQQQFTFYIKEFEQIRNLQTRSNQEIERLFEGLMTEVFMGELFA